MALKGDRNLIETDVTFHLNSVAEKGMCLFFSTPGSGAALDQGIAVLQVGGNNPSGLIPAGAILQDMVNKDLTKTHINWHRDEVQVGGKVTVVRKGWLVTNLVIGTPSVAANGSNAYATVSGYYTPTVSATGGVAATPRVGQFLSSFDEDGYCKIELNLPY